MSHSVFYMHRGLETDASLLCPPHRLRLPVQGLVCRAQATGPMHEVLVKLVSQKGGGVSHKRRECLKNFGIKDGCIVRQLCCACLTVATSSGSSGSPLSSNLVTALS